MAKSFLYRFFGLGKIPRRYRREVEQEGILLQDEGLALVLRYRNFRSPTAYYGRRISLAMGSIVLTKRSFACFRGNFVPPVFHIPIPHESVQAFDISLDDEARLQIVIDAPAFQDGWEGTIDCRIPTEYAGEFLRALRKIQS